MILQLTVWDLIFFPLRLKVSIVPSTNWACEIYEIKSVLDGKLTLLYTTGSNMSFRDNLTTIAQTQIEFICDRSGIVSRLDEQGAYLIKSCSTQGFPSYVNQSDYQFLVQWKTSAACAPS
jgi:hypothetical protein